jgi:3-hydroxyacyl-[acyl-carrier-protein] dehydratase
MQTRTPLTPAEILAMIPQQPPFRFVDKILEVGEDQIEGSYRFSPDLFFYQGHFPQRPITPGVILLESMAQVAVVAFGIYLFYLTYDEDLSLVIPMFADGSFELLAPVYPGDTVTIRAKKIFFRQRKIRSQVEMLRAGQLVALSTVSGVAVSK